MVVGSPDGVSVAQKNLENTPFAPLSYCHSWQEWFVSTVACAEFQ